MALVGRRISLTNWHAPDVQEVKIFLPNMMRDLTLKNTNSAYMLGNPAGLDTLEDSAI